MTTSDILASLVGFLRNYGAGIALAFTWALAGWVYFRQRSDWAGKRFRTQVNFSLNYVADGRLVMRTLLETSVREVWINDYGVKQVTQAANRTTAEQPFLRFAGAADQEFIDRAVLNVLSEKFSDAYLAETLGLPVRTAVYRFAITFERHEVMRTYKLRVLVVREDDLAAAFGDPGPGGALHEEPRGIYRARLQTLRAMHDWHCKAGQPGVAPLGRVVLGLRA
jgi:hypothetical protein